MEQIDQKQLIDKIQRQYDSLISFSDNANENSKKDMPPSAQQYWAGKAEAYSYAAISLDAAMAAAGIMIKSRPIVHQVEDDQARREHCSDLDEHESAIAYEHH